MVLLHSKSNLIGTPAPHFSLESVNGEMFSLDSFKQYEVIVVLFICEHCPYVKAIEDRLLKLYRDVHSLGVEFIGICSNDPTEYPDDSPDNLRRVWTEKDYHFPYLIDETQEVAKRFEAVCTPDIFVYDRQRRLAYHGRVDDNWKNPSKVTKEDLREAILKLVEGKKIERPQISSLGCSIKWKKP